MSPPARRAKNKKQRPTRWDRYGYLFIAPWLVGFLLFVAGPMIASVALSFTDYDLSSINWVGIDNYRQLLWAPHAGGRGDPLLWTSLWNTFYYTLFAVPLGLTGSLLLAMLLNQKLRGLAFFRTAYYLPSLVPTIASSLLWIWILQPDRGLLNQFLGWLYQTWPIELLERWLGFQFATPSWLQSTTWSKPSLILMSLWAVGGSRMLIFLAGLQGISDQYYEAAKIDGAGAFSRFRHITLPLISPMIFFNLVLGVIGAFQTFTQVYIMTGQPPGGPDNSTLMYAVYLYRQAFEFFRMGRASAMAWILFVVLLALTYFQFRQSRKWVHYEGGDSDQD